jgi:alpha-glucosidase (family GH31 glycosyl hydrolase)
MIGFRQKKTRGAPPVRNPLLPLAAFATAAFAVAAAASTAVAPIAIATFIGGSTLIEAQAPPQQNIIARAENSAADSTAAAEPPASARPAEGAYDPVADPRAVVTLGHARFTVLTPELIRMEWASDGHFEDHASLVFLNRRLPVPRYKHSTEGNKLTIQTAALKLVYSPGAGPNANQDGRFTPDNLTINLSLGNQLVVWRPGMADAENLMGTTRTLDGALGDKTREPIEQGLISRSGWAMVDDSSRPLFDSDDFSFRHGENSPWPWVMERPAGDRQDWYFFGYGHDYKNALGDFVRVAGRIPIPPRFAFGTWWSRYWAYSDQEIQEIVRGFHENDVPLDVFVIDMDWHPTFGMQFNVKDASGNAKGWTGYSWNKLLFPDPNLFLDWLHGNHLKTSLNLHPASGIQPWEDAYPAMAKAMGIDPATKQYVPFDPTNKNWATNYFKLVLHPLEKQGIDFWWLDWQQEPMMSKVPGLSNTWWLNYIHFTDQQREGRRPLLFHRWGGLGNHRYQIGFSGDTISVWPSLAFQPWFTATAANVGYAYWSHDIGGHVPGAVDPELFTRWVQFGAFSPILRTHTTKNPESERRIWAYPEPYSSILRDTFHLRYALQPYIYTEARRTYDTGVAFLRPLYYDWPDAPEAYTSKDEYVFGDDMIVAPVVSAADPVTKLAAEDVWLPKGNWIEWPTGKHLAGGQTVKRSFAIDQIPVYLKAGAIVPMQPPMEYTGQKPIDPLIVNVWPLDPGQSSAYSVYEDSGVSVDYQRGAFTRLPIKAAQTGDMLKVEIGPVEGSFAGMLRTRGYELRLPADWPPEQVTVNGAPIHKADALGKNGWSFEGNTLTTIIPVPRFSVESRVTIEVRRAQGLAARRAELDGFEGAMNRLRGAYDAMHETWPVSHPPDELVDAMQSGDRLGYHPEMATEELKHFHDTLPQAQGAIEAEAKDFAARLNEESQRISAAHRPSDMEAQKARRLEAMSRAQKLAAAAVEDASPESSHQAAAASTQ